ncbi:MAG: aminopeptidase N [Pseudomonadota bacterium]
MRTDTPKTIYLKDYTPPVYSVEHVNLYFELYDDKTVVKADTYYKRIEERKGPLVLNGEHQKLISIQKDDQDFEDYRLDDKTLVIDNPGDQFSLSITTKIDPASNTALEGLYKSGDTYCTQCEAEGFRRITYYQDRPDVLSTMSVRIEADKDSYPVLLSNGDLMDEGDLGKGRHYTVWNDSTPKPCYLFALVAGNLVHIKDQFTTGSGNDVDLYIYVRPGDETQCDHAMASLIKSMKWDEEVYGREYQYSRFNIVAVSDFNMGAMENTSLNVFNTALVLAQQETATDTDFMRVESVIAHEYFHNWTGNRVTCRDWFQLSLKEGLTVFRDQEFSADLNSRSVQRIDDVSSLRRLQFPEDAGPLAHPIRPDNYIEINNFYTMTVYEKGAEVIRMFHTLLGPETYRKATDLYFERYDGMAVTCEDWAQCMEDASGQDLSQFKLWYSQAGTPEVNAQTNYDESAQQFSITFKQNVPDTPGQTDKKPMHIPIAVGLIGSDGDDLIETRVLDFKESEQSFSFGGIAQKPVPSILRNFSAPIKLTSDLSNDDLAFLMVHDSDGFNRWEAGQTYSLNIIQDMLDNGSDVPADYLSNMGALYDRALDPSSDKALIARAISIPWIPEIAQKQDIVDPQAIHETREKVLNALLDAHGDKLKELYETNRDDGTYAITPEAMGKRALKNSAMLHLVNYLTPDDAALLMGAYNSSDNMTDRMAAFNGLVNCDHSEHGIAVTDFFEKFKAYPLVIDKWFSAQAMARRTSAFDDLQALREHTEFHMKNPNRVRSLYGAFAMNNPVIFHSADGRGYNFLKDFIIELCPINPQISARLLTPMREWRRYTPDRQEKMKAALEEILNTPDLPADVFEIVSKSLK